MARRKKTIANNSFSEILLYSTPNGKMKVEIFLEERFQYRPLPYLIY